MNAQVTCSRRPSKPFNEDDFKDENPGSRDDRAKAGDSLE